MWWLQSPVGQNDISIVSLSGKTKVSINNISMNAVSAMHVRQYSTLHHCNSLLLQKRISAHLILSRRSSKSRLRGSVSPEAAERNPEGAEGRGDAGKSPFLGGAMPSAACMQVYVI
jgi:hypothetical protein